MAIKIDFLANVRDFLRGTKDTEKALDDVSDSLDDVVKDGDKGEKQLEKNFKEIADAARDTDKAVEGIGGTTKTTMKDAGGTTAEFKDEAKANFSEVASSFSGDMASAADLVQGTLGGLAGSIGGPLGIALGAASIALGAVIAQAQKDAEKAEDLRLQAIDAVTSAFEQGVDVSEFLSAADQVAERIAELEKSKEGTDQRFFWEEDPSRLEEWSDALHKVGRKTSEVGDVLEADTKSLKKYEDATENAKDAVDEQIDALKRKGMLTSTDLANLIALEDESAAYDDILKNVRDEVTLRDQAADSAKRQGDAGMTAARDAIAAEEEATAAAEDAAARRQELAQSVTDSTVAMYDSVRDAAADAATSDDGVFDLQKWLDLVAESKIQADAYRANIASMQLTPEQWENFLALPEDTRASIAASYVVADDTTKSSITTALTDAGSSGGSGATVAFDDAFNPSSDVEVTATADTKAATTAIKNVADATYVASVHVKPDAESYSQTATALDGLAKGRTAPIAGAFNGWQAQQDFDAFIRNNNYKRITVYADIVKGREQV